MLRIFINFILLFVAINCAPAPELSPIVTPITHQYLILTPQAQAVQYEPVLKLQQPIFQQITPLGRYRI